MSTIVFPDYTVSSLLDTVTLNSIISDYFGVSCQAANQITTLCLPGSVIYLSEFEVQCHIYRCVRIDDLYSSHSFNEIIQVIHCLNEEEIHTVDLNMFFCRKEILATDPFSSDYDPSFTICEFDYYYSKKRLLEIGIYYKCTGQATVCLKLGAQVSIHKRLLLLAKSEANKYLSSLY